MISAIPNGLVLSSIVLGGILLFMGVAIYVIREYAIYMQHKIDGTADEASHRDDQGSVY